MGTRTVNSNGKIHSKPARNGVTANSAANGKTNGKENHHSDSIGDDDFILNEDEVPDETLSAVIEQDDELEHLPEEGSPESHIDDPIRMYLMQMGEIPMLNREDEISSARRIEETRARFRYLLLGNDFVLQAAVELLEKVQNGELRLDRTIEISVTNTRRRSER